MANRHVELVNSCNFTIFSKILTMEIEQKLFCMLLILYLDRRCLKISQFSLNWKRTKTWDPYAAHILLNRTNYTYIFGCTKIMWAGIAQWVYRLATDWTVRGSNPSESPIICTLPHRLWSLPSILNYGYLVFPGGKAVVLTTHPYLWPRFKKGYSYIFTLHLGLRGLFWGEFYIYWNSIPS
jgi:hypothetical protein